MGRFGWGVAPLRHPSAGRLLKTAAARAQCPEFTEDGPDYAQGNAKNCADSSITGDIATLDGVQLLPPEGSFYAFPDVSTWGIDSLTLCTRLLDEVGLAVVPGAAFGDDRCIRLSCAASPETLRDGIERLARFRADLPLLGVLRTAVVHRAGSLRLSPLPDAPGRSPQADRARGQRGVRLG